MPVHIILPAPQFGNLAQMHELPLQIMHEMKQHMEGSTTSNQQTKHWSKQQNNMIFAHSHPVPFFMPSMEWTHWSGNSENSKMRDDLITKRLVDGMSALEVQIRFQKYRPDSFSKNLSCQEQDM